MKIEMELVSRPFDKATATNLRKAKSAKAKAMFKGAAGRPKASELERRKTLAIKVATDLFMKNGYAATSLNEIAKDAGVSRRTIYQHFGDKGAMFREVILACNRGSFVQPPTVEPGSTLFFNTLPRFRLHPWRNL